MGFTSLLCKSTTRDFIRSTQTHFYRCPFLCWAGWGASTRNEWWLFSVFAGSWNICCPSNSWNPERTVIIRLIYYATACDKTKLSWCAVASTERDVITLESRPSLLLPIVPCYIAPHTQFQVVVVSSTASYSILHHSLSICVFVFIVLLTREYTELFHSRRDGCPRPRHDDLTWSFASSSSSSTCSWLLDPSVRLSRTRISICCKPQLQPYSPLYSQPSSAVNWPF